MSEKESSVSSVELDSSKPVVIHRRLNSNQKELLVVLYKFRFGTVKLISQFMDQSIRNTNVRLKNLYEQEYIGRLYDSSYKLTHRPAVYYLLPKGITWLKDHIAELEAMNLTVNEDGLHRLYYNRKASAYLVSHNLKLFRLSLRFADIFNDKLSFYTGTELAGYSLYADIKPDVLIRFRKTYSELPECLVILAESSKPGDFTRRQVAQFISHAQEVTWERNGGETDYPRVLAICDSFALEREVRYMITRAMNYNGGDEPIYYTTNLKSLYGTKNPKARIWASVSDPDERVAIGDM